MFLDQFPYTNMHEINLDWIIQQIKALDPKVIAALQQIDPDVLAQVTAEVEKANQYAISAQSASSAASASAENAEKSNSSAAASASSAAGYASSANQAATDAESSKQAAATSASTAAATATIAVNTAISIKAYQILKNSDVVSNVYVDRCTISGKTGTFFMWLVLNDSITVGDYIKVASIQDNDFAVLENFGIATHASFTGQAPYYTTIAKITTDSNNNVNISVYIPSDIYKSTEMLISIPFTTN